MYDFNQYLKPWKEEKFVVNLDDAIYHAEPAVSCGQLKTIMDREGGVHKLHAEKNGAERKETPALRFGTLFHKACLEGPEFVKHLRVVPEFVGLTKDGRPSSQSGEAKAKKAAWFADLPKNAIVLDGQEEMDQITGMMNALLAHPVAKILMTGGQRELSGFFNHAGFRCRIRIDLFQESLVMVNDLKTTKNALKSQFQRQIEDEMYFMQASFYLMGCSKILKKNIQSFNFIAVEKEPPYLVSVHEVGMSHLSVGDIYIKTALAKLERAIKTNNWLPEAQIAYTSEASEWLMREAQKMEN